MDLTLSEVGEKKQELVQGCQREVKFTVGIASLEV